MNYYYLIRCLLLISLFTVLGCKDQLKQLIVPTNEKIYGKYVSIDDDSYLLFDQDVTLYSQHGNMVKSYTVKNERITVTMHNSERESRKSVQFLMVDEGSRLLCSVCAAVGLGVIWEKEY